MPGSGSGSGSDRSNLLSGSQGHKKRRPSFWGCRPSETGARSTGRSRESRRSREQRSDEPPSKTNCPPSPRPSDPTLPQRPGSDHKKDSANMVPGGGFWSSSARNRITDYDDAPTRASHFTVRPFSQLVSHVKRCPWMLGSDLHPFETASDFADDVFFPLVPRSLLHDTAVSFVITDHTRVEQPQFVISCPLEHIEIVHRLLAPEGSHRQLTARGSSRQPRNADQLRSMLLDGTPNIELSLHWAPAFSAGRSAPGSDDLLRPGGGFEFQGNVFPHRQGYNRGNIAGPRGRPSDSGSNREGNTPTGDDGDGDDPASRDLWSGNAGSGNVQAQSAWAVNGT